jgi:Bacteriophage related domain of unknown function
LTIYNDIRAVLENRLATTPNVPEIAFQNVPYTRLEATTFLKATFVPVTRRLATMGDTPQQVYRGIYNILACVPENEGNGRGLDLVDTILARFPAALDLNYNGQYLTIEYSEVGTSFLDSPYYCTPITISWYCYHT